MAKIDMAFFPTVEGSMTRKDGHTFMLHVKRPTGGDLLLGLGPYALELLAQEWSFSRLQSKTGASSVNRSA